MGEDKHCAVHDEKDPRDLDDDEGAEQDTRRVMRDMSHLSQSLM